MYSYGAVKTPMTELIIGMLDNLEDGYYAVQPNAAHPHLDFIRVSRPTDRRSKYKGAVKVQTIHAETLYDRWAYWPDSDRLMCLDNGIEGKLLLLLANKRAAARRYAHEIERCHRCNTQLTDERSRHYGFGPECEKHLEAEKDEIDDENGGTFEELLARGELIK
jgi:hypothetical protein